MAQVTLTAHIDVNDKNPFAIKQTPDSFFIEPNLSHVKKSVQELRVGKGTAHELIEVENGEKICNKISAFYIAF